MPRLARVRSVRLLGLYHPAAGWCPGEQQFRSTSLLNLSLFLSTISILHLFVISSVKPRARVTYDIVKPTRERPPSAHTEESRPCFFSRISLFVSERDGSLLGPSFGLPDLGRERRARVTHPKVSGRVRLSGSPATRASASASNAGERSPWAARPVSAGHLPRFLHCR